MMQIYAKFSNLVYKILKSRLQNSQISPDTPFRHPERAYASCHLERAYASCHLERAYASCHPDRVQRVEGSVVSAPLSPKAEWKNAHANKNAFAAFSIPLFLSNAVVLSAAEGPVSFMSPRASVERSVVRGGFPGFCPPDLRSE